MKDVPTENGLQLGLALTIKHINSYKKKIKIFKHCFTALNINLLECFHNLI